MVLKSEGLSVKSVQQPARDKRYALIAYARLLVEKCDQMPQETISNLSSGLIELGSAAQGGFLMASNLEKSIEE